MLEGVVLLMGRKILFFVFLFLFPCSIALAQSEEQREEKKEEPNILAVVKDAQGGILEGYLRAQPGEITVSSKDNQEKIIPTKYIKSITLEKVKEEGPADADPKQEARYSVRVRNSQEIYTLSKKYTFSLLTDVGMVTRSIEPETINRILLKDASAVETQKSDKDKPFILDKSIVFSLEFKF
jgi:hypothetical protein